MYSDFTLGLALYDFLPVIFTGIAVYFIARLIQEWAPSAALAAGVGAGLVTLAGLSKATWKLIVTVTGQDLTWLANALFPLMAPGFILLAVGMWMARRVRTGKAAPGWVWMLPLLLILLTYANAAYQTWGAGVERGWFMPIMTLASVGNIGLTILLMMSAGRRRWGLALLFTVNLLMVFALIPIAQIEPKSVGLHWFEQTLTTVGAAAFALASYRLLRLSRAKQRPADIPRNPGQPPKLAATGV